jgi:hypothetical protein
MTGRAIEFLIGFSSVFLFLIISVQSELRRRESADRISLSATAEPAERRRPSGSHAGGLCSDE